MTITVRLEPDVETRLLARARAEGMSLDDYLQGVIAQVATGGGAPKLSLEEFEAGLDVLAEGSEGLPVLTPDAYRRESIYGEQ